ncbi:uncharacterized protein TM35_000381880 [Trypanosoma theileri]|uniref:Uncharacterized protein n=1 Tax=Trypanosoma theileri TaxID=67003 RepID=A0A1X0NKY2_9TRYP|nr:uncharacterized protein TM35_000381880 [Trypanosoma theileri]ORC85113.1 hypothetical protein TM35_000381880 [Trypanosoma theileri]
MNVLQQYSLQYLGDEDLLFYVVFMQLPVLLLTIAVCLWMKSSYENFLIRGGLTWRRGERTGERVTDEEHKEDEVIPTRSSSSSSSSSSSISDSGDSGDEGCKKTTRNVQRISLEELYKRSEMITRTEKRWSMPTEN